MVPATVGAVRPLCRDAEHVVTALARPVVFFLMNMPALEPAPNQTAIRALKPISLNVSDTIPFVAAIQAQAHALCRDTGTFWLWLWLG